MDRAFNRSKAEQQEEKRLLAELAAINKEMTAVKARVKTRYGLVDDEEEEESNGKRPTRAAAATTMTTAPATTTTAARFGVEQELEVSKISRLPSYLCVRPSTHPSARPLVRATS